MRCEDLLILAEVAGHSCRLTLKHAAIFEEAFDRAQIAIECLLAHAQQNCLARGHGPRAFPLHHATGIMSASRTSVAKFREPLDRPLGLPDWPDLNCVLLGGFL